MLDLSQGLKFFWIIKDYRGIVLDDISARI
jgi:hypothetical protein